MNISLRLFGASYALSKNGSHARALIHSLSALEQPGQIVKQWKYTIKKQQQKNKFSG